MVLLKLGTQFKFSLRIENLFHLSMIDGYIIHFLICKEQ